MVKNIEEAKELICRLDSSVEDVNEGRKSYSQHQRDLMLWVELPKFADLGHEHPHYTISKNASKFVIQNTTDLHEAHTVSDHYTLYEAVKEVKLVAPYATLFVDIEDVSLGGLDFYHILVDPEGEGPDLRVDVYESAVSNAVNLSYKKTYVSFLREAILYHENPTDFFHAYQFVMSHPAYWIYFGGTQNLNTFGSALDLTVTKDDEGRTVFMIESGGAEPIARESHYHDVRTDSYGSTYEEVIMGWARNTFNVFDLQGQDI